MNSPTAAGGGPPSGTPRFDAKFIEDHGLIERYLENKLPVKGARDLEHWCRANPDYLKGLKLAERAQASIRLLEASGRPLDMRDPDPPWWQSPYLAVGLCVTALSSLVAFWALFSKYELLRGELEDARTRLRQGSLVQPAVDSSARVSPDRAPGVDRARIAVDGGAPQLMDLHIDMGYSKATLFRMIVDKKNQGRALILNNLLKDSNGELRITLNTTGIAAGIYGVRLEALPFHASGSPHPEGWFVLEVR